MHILLKYLWFSILMSQRAGPHDYSKTVAPKLCATVPSQMTSTAHSAPHNQPGAQPNNVFKWLLV